MKSPSLPLIITSAPIRHSTSRHIAGTIGASGAEVYLQDQPDGDQRVGGIS
jgi:hypothetical protein